MFSEFEPRDCPIHRVRGGILEEVSMEPYPTEGWGLIYRHPSGGGPYLPPAMYSWRSPSGKSFEFRVIFETDAGDPLLAADFGEDRLAMIRFAADYGVRGHIPPTEDDLRREEWERRRADRLRRSTIDRGSQSRDVDQPWRRREALAPFTPLGAGVIRRHGRSGGAACTTVIHSSPR